MLRFILKRIILSAATIWIIITLTFVLMHAVPGSPFNREKALPPGILENLETKHRLNDPLWIQYGTYLKSLARGDLGSSLHYPGVSVGGIIAEGFPVSARLGLTSFLIITGIGIPAGIFSALHRNKIRDYLVLVCSALGTSIPSFVLGPLLIYLFGVKLGWLPTSRWESWKSVILPAITLAAYPTAYLARLTRVSILETTARDFFRTAKAQGLPPRVILPKHVLKNALLPVVSYLSPTLALLLTGSFVVEKIFALPGLGQHYVLSIGNRDYPLILGMTLFYGTLMVTLNLVADIVYSLVDPRVRISEGGK